MRRKFFLQLHNLKGLRMVRQMRRGFGATCTNSYTSEKIPSRYPLNASQRGAENAANAPQVFSAIGTI